MLSALVLLGLGAALSWGADFWAGLQARRLGTVGVTLWSQAAGTLAVGLVLVLVHEPLQPAPLLWGLAAGVADGVALLLFYRGLATGMMAVVAPIAACGALVPVVAALLRGQTPARRWVWAPLWAACCSSPATGTRPARFAPRPAGLSS